MWLLTKLSFIKLLKHNTANIGKTIVVVVQDLEVVENPEYICGSSTCFEPSLDDAECERRRKEPVSIVKN